jgi:hypothetical protein
MHHQRDKNLDSISAQRDSVAASVVPSSSILVTLMMEEVHSSETPVLTGATRRHIPDNISCSSQLICDCNQQSSCQNQNEIYVAIDVNSAIFFGSEPI